MQALSVDSLKNWFLSHWQTLLLILIVVASFGLRIFRLDSVRLTHDEMSIGYNAYSILETGRDEWGRFMPLDFEAFGDHKLPLYIYAAVPSTAVFGLSALGVKLPSLVSGAIFMVAIYVQAREISVSRGDDDEIDWRAWGAVLAAATAPVLIHFSRSGLESHLALTLFSIGNIFALHWIRGQALTWWGKLLWASTWGLSWYAYVGYRLLVILAVGALLVTAAIERWRRNAAKQWRDIAVTGAIFAVVVLPLVGVLFSFSGTARFSATSVFGDAGVAASVENKHNYCFMSGGPLVSKVCRIFFNEPLQTGLRIAKPYFATISTPFLFLEGDELAYLQLDGYGTLLLPFLPLVYWGLFRWFRRGESDDLWLLALFFLAPIPTALTGSPQVVRTSLLFLPLVLAAGEGSRAAVTMVSRVFDRKTKIVTLSLGTAVYLSIVAFMGIRYHLDAWYIGPLQQQTSWYQIGSETIHDILQRTENYENVYFDSTVPDAHIAFAFYGKDTPAEYTEKLTRKPTDDLGFSHPEAYGNITFTEQDASTLLCENESGLVITPDDPSFIPKSLRNAEAEIIHRYSQFSGVHAEAYAIDIARWRTAATEKNMLTSLCGE